MFNKNDVASYTNLVRIVEPEDLIKFGLIPEFIGRLPVITTLDALDKDALIEILLKPKNALTKQFQKLFIMEGVDLEFRDDALDAIAEKALERKSGARGLRSIIEVALKQIMFEIPSISNLEKVVIDKNVILKNQEPYMIFSESKKEQST